MFKNIKRKIFPQISKYQRHVVFLVFFSAMVMHFSLFGVLSMMNTDLLDIVLKGADGLAIGKIIDQWTMFIIIMSGFFMALYLVLAYMISCNLVGAFERILRELDQIIAGERRGPVVAREHDGLANEVLERVNKLIERLPKQ